MTPAVCDDADPKSVGDVGLNQLPEKYVILSVIR